MFCFSNRSGAARELSPGLYGISNHLLDTPWPKVVNAKHALRTLLESGGPTIEGLMDVLADNRKPHDDQLPDTGVGVELERMLAPAFIRSPDYGTRCSTVVLVKNDGQTRFVERTFPADGSDPTDAVFEFCADEPLH